MEIIKLDLEDKKYPQRLLETKNFPVELYCVGNIDLLNSKYTAAIVGSRACSKYGMRVTNELTKKI